MLQVKNLIAKLALLTTLLIAAPTGHLSVTLDDKILRVSSDPQAGQSCAPREVGAHTHVLVRVGWRWRKVAAPLPEPVSETLLTPTGPSPPVLSPPFPVLKSANWRSLHHQSTTDMGPPTPSPPFPTACSLALRPFSPRTPPRPSPHTYTGSPCPPPPLPAHHLYLTSPPAHILRLTLPSAPSPRAHTQVPLTYHCTPSPRTNTGPSRPLRVHR